MCPLAHFEPRLCTPCVHAAGAYRPPVHLLENRILNETSQELLVTRNPPTSWVPPSDKGQAIGLLVMVSSMPHGTSTSILSTPYSPGGLPESLPWTSHLEEGFTLRCLQRLSQPGLAILPWGGRPNRSTSDPSIPVLSY